ncbi:UPF0160 protein-like [Iris pallida]|uniref:UPF0160 protein-like n=1 Tax=Iris pallida TaxID=29817 RepID=A0AAX6HIV3_IRIPA|nr:UPF0160 protein-like [Iris pallida]
MSCTTSNINGRSKQWRVQAVAKSPDGFESRSPLPLPWMRFCPVVSSCSHNLTPPEILNLLSYLRQGK